MPTKEVWEKFFHPAEALGVMGLDSTVKDVVEFGCGYGTFTIPAARIIAGTIYAIDVEADMVEATRTAAASAALRNVNVMRRDFVAEGTGLKAASVDYAMLFNILHIEHPETLLKEAWRILRIGGKLGIIHWNYDPATPRGPSMDIRPKPAQCVAWAEAAGFGNLRQRNLPPYHYGIVMNRQAAPA